MTKLEMADAPPPLRGWLARAKRKPAVLTLHGRPVAALTPIDEGEWERVVVALHPGFQRLLQESRDRCPPGKGISTAEMRRRLGRRRDATAARSRRGPARKARASARG
jgi:antitoxin (DNA-binding transcriptional repressor) of toxin-antitoxin stability system